MMKISPAKRKVLRDLFLFAIAKRLLFLFTLCVKSDIMTRRSFIVKIAKGR